MAGLNALIKVCPPIPVGHGIIRVLLEVGFTNFMQQCAKRSVNFGYQ